MVTESFLPRVNGVTNSVCRILEHFADRGHQALVITPGPGPEEYLGHRIVAVPGVGLPGYRSFKLGLPMARLERLLTEFGPDVVHLASPVAVGAAGASAARRMGVPSVAVFQTDVAGFARRYGFRGTDRAIWAWLRHVHRAADRTLVPSRATLAQLHERDIPRLAMWRRGVDAQRFHPRHRSESLRAELAGPDEILVGYVGRLAGDKRVHLMAGLHDVPGVRLVIVGDGPAAPRLRALMPQARFPGFMGGQELSTMYASLDVFVHTGADETFCQAIQEAMASGVPVVAPAAGGPLDLVEAGRTGLFYHPESGDQLREAVATLAVNPTLRAEFGQRARELVVDRTWPAVCDELIGHYRDVIAARAAANRANGGAA